jgi:hypothetical protein
MNQSTQLKALRWLLPVQLLLIANLASGQAQPSDATTERDDDVVVLSPFEVVADTTGYYKANTMSGTRFNAKLDDLASSISIVTTQQMADFGMLDLNDVFLYVAGTEGTGTYTDFTLDRNGSIGDNVQSNPTQANRVRGIAPANVSLGNIETMGRVPVDPISVESIEVSRGPNANVFGLGNPSGTVNMVPVSAHLQRDHNRVELRADSVGGYRTSLDMNRVLLDEKLAIRVSGVFQHDAFERKPSGVDTERYNVMLKWQPYRNTTISGSYSYYHAYGNRPNTIPPRDNLSYWIASGRPTWDPVTQQIHIAGQTVATVTAANYNGPDYFSAAYLGNDRGQMWVDQGGISYWSAPRGTTSTVMPSLATLQAARYLQPTAAAGAVFSGTAPRPFAQFLFNTTPTISDKSIYDWESINLSAPNRFWDRTATTNFQIDQIIFNSRSQTLAAQVTFMREDAERWVRNIAGVINDNGQSGQLTVDINERRLDGTPNPFFLRPYIGVDKPRTTLQPQVWDTARAQVAYRLDLTDSDSSLLRNLGWFQLTAYGEYKDRQNRQYSWRDGMSGDVPWLPAGQYRGFQSTPSGTPAVVNTTQTFFRYYVGDNSGNNVDYAPAEFSYGLYPFIWGNAATNSFRTDTLEFGEIAADKTGGTFNTKTILKTVGGVVQSHLFGDRLVTTLGARYDNTFLHFGHPGSPTNAYAPDGINFDYELTDAWAEQGFDNGGRTTNVQFVLRPFMKTRVTANLVESSTGGSRFFGSLLDGLSVNFNKSNSFLPTNPAQDLYRNLLPNTTGTDKSWGLGLNLFEGKLVIRATRYDNFQRDAQTNDMSTVAGRVLRVDFLTNGAGSPTPSHNLYSNATRWVTWANPTFTPAQVAAEVENQTGLSAEDLDYYDLATPPIGATSDIRSTGTEVEINFNPNRFWTVTGSVTENESITQNISSALVDWIDERMPIWTTIVDPSISDANAATEGNPGKLWWKHRYTQAGTAPAPGTPATFTASAATPEQNFQAFVQAPFGIIQAQEGKNNPQVRRYNFRMSTSYKLEGISENKWLKKLTIGGAVRWEDKAAIGYFGVQSLPNIITDLDPNRPIYDKSHYYVDMFVSYKTKLWDDRVNATFKVNVRNLGENGRLQPVGAFPDGSIHTYRIIDPQVFFFTASFDL